MYLATYTELNLALGGDVELTLVTDKPRGQVQLLFAKLWLAVYSFEKQFSRFISSSELSKFNRRAGERVEISREFSELLKSAKEMAIKTDGRFNPFILPMLQRTGYRKSFVKHYEHDHQEDYSNRRVASPQELLIEGDYAQIPQNTALDMGGCGKGYLADRLSEFPELSDVQGYWFSLGGDVVGAGLDEDGMPWQVSIEDALNPGSMLDMVAPMKTDKFCIATSGVIERKGINGSRHWHHLIDPATGAAASTDVLLATVCAPTTLEADVLASCTVIAGTDHALDYARSHGASSAFIQSKGAQRTVEYRHFGTFVEHKGVKSI